MEEKGEECYLFYDTHKYLDILLFSDKDNKP